MRTAIKWGAVMEKTTTNFVQIRGYNDNEAVRVAFTHGSSSQMSHMTRHAGVHFELVRSIGLIPRHIDGEDNLSDMFTKILGAKRLRWLLRRLFNLEHPNVDPKVSSFVARSSMTRRATIDPGAFLLHCIGCEHEGVHDFGKAVLGTCFCRMQTFE